MKYDSVIIGFGKGGKTLAAYLGGTGESVALIEQSEMMYGGTCINVACIPTKSLLNRAEKRGDKEGQEKEDHYAAGLEEKDRVTALLRGKNFEKLDQHDYVTVYTGQASFLSKQRITVKLKDETVTLEADKIFINTGSRPVMPLIDGIRGAELVYDSRSIMNLESLPEKLIIVGGGPIALEFAAIYANFGSAVTLIIREEQFLLNEDRDMADAIMAVMEKKNISILLQTEISSIREEGDRIYVTAEKTGSLEKEEIFAHAVLMATGRKPCTENLGLEAAGIKTGERGEIMVDEKLKTDIPGIWALGDVHGGPQFTYTSLDDFRIIRAQLNEGESPYSLDKRKHVPVCTFIDPPYAKVGLNDQEARTKGFNVKISKIPATSVPKAHVMEKTDGLLKAVIDEDTGKILGAQLFCAEAHEIINLVKMALDLELDYTYFRDQIFTHPTMAEALNDLFDIT